MLVTIARVGVQRQERAVALVGLGHQVVALAPARVGQAERVDAAADDRGRVEAGRHQHRVHHRRRGGLAVGAGDRDAELHAHQLAEHLGARDDRDLARARRLDLGVVALDRRRHDHHVGLAEVIGAVALPHRAADRPQVTRDLGVVLIRARDLVAHVGQHLGEATHAHAADADEVDLGVRLAKHRDLGDERAGVTHGGRTHSGAGLCQRGAYVPEATAAGAPG
jgi:hypothetical protein